MEKIISLVRQWQNKGYWQATFELYADWKRTYDNISRYDGARQSAIQRENAQSLRKAWSDGAEELGQIFNGLREHAPKLLHLVPVVDWSEMPTDYKPLIAAMLKLEGELLAMRATPPPNETVVQTTVARLPAIEARDKWLYGQCISLVAYGTIIKRLASKPQSWDRIESINGIKKVAAAYATRHELPPIPQRQRGRPVRR